MQGAKKKFRNFKKFLEFGALCQVPASRPNIIINFIEKGLANKFAAPYINN